MPYFSCYVFMEHRLSLSPNAKSATEGKGIAAGIGSIGKRKEGQWDNGSRRGCRCALRRHFYSTLPSSCRKHCYGTASGRQIPFLPCGTRGNAPCHILAFESSDISGCFTRYIQAIQVRAGLHSIVEIWPLKSKSRARRSAI